MRHPPFLVKFGPCAAALLLAGCGNSVADQSAFPPSPATYHPPAPPPSLLTPPARPADPLAAADDPLADGADALDSDAGRVSTDPLAGPVMPTQHSHWLNTEMQDARITILLNGLRLGGFMAPGTRDITMKLHQGSNALTVIYEPNSARSWASVTVDEGEHDPPIPPLVVFRRAPLLQSDTKPGTVTQQFTFYAR